LLRGVPTAVAGCGLPTTTVVGGGGGERRVERERPRVVERGLVDAPPAYGDVKSG
jgi:hypothetical protein